MTGSPVHAPERAGFNYATVFCTMAALAVTVAPHPTATTRKALPDRPAATHHAPAMRTLAFSFTSVLLLAFPGCDSDSGESTGGDADEGAMSDDGMGTSSSSGGDTGTGTTTMGTDTGGTGGDDGLAAQLSRGEQLYATDCALCHGANGAGVPSLGPAIIGAGALPKLPPADATLRTVEFSTALDIYTWTHANMPTGSGGTVAPADMWAIVAFQLDAHGIALSSALDASNAASIVVNP